MKKLLLILLLLPASLMAKVPVEDDIIDKINDPSSAYYYPNLFIRFNNGESNFTPEEFHYLYYGFAYNELYKPLTTNDKIDRVLLLASNIDPDVPSSSAIDEIIISANEALALNPFSPTLWNLLAYAYGTSGDKEREQMAFNRFNLILSTIDSSGDGLKEKSPKHIIMFDHALDLLTVEGIAHDKAKVISRTVEFIPFIETLRDGGKSSNGKKVKGLYFDFGRIYWNKPDDVSYKRDQTWQFNNLKPKEYK